MVERESRTTEHHVRGAFDPQPLPTRVPGRDVKLTVEQLTRFRDDYNHLLGFAAQVCGVAPTELTREHCDAWMYEERGVPTFWMLVAEALRDDDG